MGQLFGYPEDVSIPAPSVTNEYLDPINGKSNDERSCIIENKDSYKEHEELLRLIKHHDSTPNYRSKDLSPDQLEDNSTASELKSDSLPQEGNKKSAKAKGKTKGNDQKLLYLDGKRWVPAVYHHNIRDFLIERASRKGQYAYPREEGPDPYDETSYLESQKDWGPVRDENWAEILYIFQKAEGHNDPTYQLKNWKVHGRIVLAGQDKLPMLRFRDLPDTLSSALSGRDMEAMKRTDPRIQQRDIMARMPLYHTTRAGIRKNVQSHSSIGMRMTRFRQKEGMLSWKERDGSQAIQNALWGRLPRENQLANSIAGLKPPTEAEQRETRMGNAGRFLNRAGRRALPKEERERRQEIRERRFRNKVREVESHESGDRNQGTKNRTPAGGAGLAEPDDKQSGHHAQHHSMQPPPIINTPCPINPFQPKQDHNPSANAFVQASDTTSTHASTTGSRMNILVPSARG